MWFIYGWRVPSCYRRMSRKSVPYIDLPQVFCKTGTDIQTVSIFGSSLDDGTITQPLLVFAHAPRLSAVAARAD